MNANGSGSAVGRMIGPDRPWVLGQLGLLGAIVAGGVWERSRHGRRVKLGGTALTAVAGVLALGAAAWVAWRAKADLGRNFTMSPTPVADGQLVQTGIYGRLRHPMYLSVVLALLGGALAVGSLVALGGAAGMLAFFLVKAAHEERLLERRYSDYAAYRERVRSRIVPKLL